MSIFDRIEAKTELFLTDTCGCRRITRIRVNQALRKIWKWLFGR